MCSLSNYVCPPAHTLSFDGSNKEGCGNSPVGSIGPGSKSKNLDRDLDEIAENWVNSQRKR